MIYTIRYTSFKIDTMFVNKMVYSIIESVHLSNLNSLYVCESENIRRTVLKTSKAMKVMTIFLYGSTSIHCPSYSLKK